MPVQLRPYQVDLIDSVRRQFSKGNRRVLVSSPTGSGKTVVLAHMMSAAARKGLRSWMIVHRRELVEQTAATLGMYGIRPNVIASGRDFSAPGNLISVCSVQSLVRRLDGRYVAPDIVIWDECHHQASATYGQVFEHVRDAWHVGLTATPHRLDGKGLAEWYDVIVEGPSTHELIQSGYLSDYRLFCPATPDLSSCKTRAGDWVTSELDALMNKPSVTGCAVEQYLDKCSGLQAIVFAASIKHSQSVAAMFNEAGVSAVHVDGGTSDKERVQRLADFRSGSTQVICNVGLFSEGFDVPGIRCCILLRPTKSLSLYLQQVGRGLRVGADPGRAVILDHAGNARTFGLPDDAREWSLGGSARRGKTAAAAAPGSIRVCGECLGASPAGATACTGCGALFAPCERELAQRAGELEEINKEALRRKRRTEQGRCLTQADLIAEGKRRGYKNPWFWAQKIMKGRGRK